MVDVTNGTNVYVRLFALKFFLTHGSLLKVVTFCGVLHEKHTLSNPANAAGQPCINEAKWRLMGEERLDGRNGAGNEIRTRNPQLGRLML